MSTLTMCNYCTLKKIREEAKAKKWRVNSLPYTGKVGIQGGTNIYVYPGDINLEKLNKDERKEYFVAWFMEISDHCVC